MEAAEGGEGEDSEIIYELHPKFRYKFEHKEEEWGEDKEEPTLVEEHAHKKPVEEHWWFVIVFSELGRKQGKQPNRLRRNFVDEDFGRQKQDKEGFHKEGAEGDKRKNKICSNRMINSFSVYVGPYPFT